MKSETKSEVTAVTVKGSVLAENLEKIEKANKSIQAALKRKHKLIEESKIYTYNQFSELFDLDGQALLDAVTAEHDLIQKFTASGLTYEQIAELADDSSSDKYGKQMSFSEHTSYSD